MKKLVPLLLLVTALSACSDSPPSSEENKADQQSGNNANDPSEASQEAHPTYENIQAQRSGHNLKAPVLVFSSHDEGTEEYMHRYFDNGRVEWYYSSEKATKQLKLGFVERNGTECVYFSSQPRKIYEIRFNNRGFTLAQGDRLQEFYAMENYY